MITVSRRTYRNTEFYINIFKNYILIYANIFTVIIHTSILVYTCNRALTYHFLNILQVNLKLDFPIPAHMMKCSWK